MRALVIGHGRMGRFHAKALRDLGCQVTTVDPNAPADMPTMPPLYRYHAAAIATPPELLGFYGIACADAGLKTLIEKPLAPTLGEAEGLAHVLGGMDVCVGFIERFNPQLQALKRNLPRVGRPLKASFHRWNDRTSTDPITDLRIHDTDLVNYLGLSCPIRFDTRADAPTKRRFITVVGADGTVTADLMDHDQSPLHAMWHAFLTGSPVPRPADAVEAHRALNSTVEAVAA